MQETLFSISRFRRGPQHSPKLIFGQLDARRQYLNVKHLSAYLSPFTKGTALLTPLAKTPEVINNESFTTSTAITRRNLYITTKGLVPLQQGICCCHTGQLPSSCNCCISMHSCKTTTILTVGFWVGYFYCFYTKTSNVTSIQLPASGFCQRGRKKHKSVLCAHFRHLQKGIFGRFRVQGRVAVGAKKRSRARGPVKPLLRVSGSGACSQSTHGEQAE